MYSNKVMQILAEDVDLKVRQAVADQYNSPQKDEGSLRDTLINPNELDHPAYN